MPPLWFLCLSSFSSWLLILNASLNFLIYCSVGTGFKEVFATLTGCSAKWNCLGNSSNGNNNGNSGTSPRNSHCNESNGRQMSLTVAVRKDSSLRLQTTESVPLNCVDGSGSNGVCGGSSNSHVTAAAVETVVANGEHHV